MRPSNLATRYQLYEKNIIPERCIETGQRYRARRNLVEHVSSPNRVSNEAECSCRFRRVAIYRIHILSYVVDMKSEEKGTMKGGS